MTIGMFGADVRPDPGLMAGLLRDRYAPQAAAANGCGAPTMAWLRQEIGRHGAGDLALSQLSGSQLAAILAAASQPERDGLAQQLDAEIGELSRRVRSETGWVPQGMERQASMPAWRAAQVQGAHRQLRVLQAMQARLQALLHLTQAAHHPAAAVLQYRYDLHNAQVHLAAAYSRYDGAAHFARLAQEPAPESVSEDSSAGHVPEHWHAAVAEIGTQLDQLIAGAQRSALAHLIDAAQAAFVRRLAGYDPSVADPGLELARLGELILMAHGQQERLAAPSGPAEAKADPDSSNGVLVDAGQASLRSSLFSGRYAVLEAYRELPGWELRTGELGEADRSALRETGIMLYDLQEAEQALGEMLNTLALPLPHVAISAVEVAHRQRLSGPAADDAMPLAVQREARAAFAAAAASLGVADAAIRRAAAQHQRLRAMPIAEHGDLARLQRTALAIMDTAQLAGREATSAASRPPHGMDMPHAHAVSPGTAFAQHLAADCWIHDVPDEALRRRILDALLDPSASHRLFAEATPGLAFVEE
jgi:hypothetical protein